MNNFTKQILFFLSGVVIASITISVLPLDSTVDQVPVLPENEALNTKIKNITPPPVVRTDLPQKEIVQNDQYQVFFKLLKEAKERGWNDNSWWFDHPELFAEFQSLIHADYPRNKKDLKEWWEFMAKSKQGELALNESLAAANSLRVFSPEWNTDFYQGITREEAWSLGIDIMKTSKIEKEWGPTPYTSYHSFEDMWGNLHPILIPAQYYLQKITGLEGQAEWDPDLLVRAEDARRRMMIERNAGMVGSPAWRGSISKVSRELGVRVPDEVYPLISAEYAGFVAIREQVESNYEAFIHNLWMEHSN